MPDPSSKTPSGSAPVVRDEAGRLSLDFDNGTVQSRLLPAEPARLVLEYTRLMMGFVLFQPAPARIAMIGLGGGSLARYCAVKLPQADFTAVEISPQVIALRDAFGVPPDGASFRVRCEDGAAFVRREAPPLDVLLVDGFDRDGQPEQLCSAAFYDDCRFRLAAAGVLVVNLHTDETGWEARVARIGDAFGGHLAVVTADHGANAVVFAGSAEAFPPSFATLVQRLRALEATHPVGLDVIVRKLLHAGAPRRAIPRRPRRRRA